MLSQPRGYAALRARHSQGRRRISEPYLGRSVVLACSVVKTSIAPHSTLILMTRVVRAPEATGDSKTHRSADPRRGNPMGPQRWVGGGGGKRQRRYRSVAGEAPPIVILNPAVPPPSAILAYP
jgi:hypothetical protein